MTLRWPADRDRIAALLTEPISDRERAERAGVSPQTISRWRGWIDPASQRGARAPKPSAGQPPAPPSGEASGSRPAPDARARAHRAALGRDPPSGRTEEAPSPNATPGASPSYTPAAVAALTEVGILSVSRVAALVMRVSRDELGDSLALTRAERATLEEHAPLIIPWLSQNGAMSPAMGALAYAAVVSIMTLPRIMTIRAVRNGDVLPTIPEPAPAPVSRPDPGPQKWSGNNKVGVPPEELEAADAEEALEAPIAQGDLFNPEDWWDPEDLWRTSCFRPGDKDDEDFGAGGATIKQGDLIDDEVSDDGGALAYDDPE